MENGLMSAEMHPLDTVEILADKKNWCFDRIADDEITLEIKKSWYTYDIILAWSSSDETLRLVCTFNLHAEKNQLSHVYELLNLVNDQCWIGAFNFWPDQDLAVYRYGLILTGGEIAGSAQVNKLVQVAVTNCERFYPVFQLTCAGQHTPEAAMGATIGETVGRH